MKKIAFIMAFVMLFSSVAQAETILVVDDNNVVTQKIVTNQISSQPQVVYTQPQQVVVSQPQVVYTQPQVVVRQTPVVRSYYYDPVATAAVAGITGIALGGILFHGGHHGRHHGGRHHHGGHRR